MVTRSALPAPPLRGDLSPRLVALFRDYADAHSHETNVWLHKVAIPLIVFHIAAMADWIPLARLPGTGAHVTAAHLAVIEEPRDSDIALTWTTRRDWLRVSWSSRRQLSYREVIISPRADNQGGWLTSPTHAALVGGT